MEHESKRTADFAQQPKQTGTSSLEDLEYWMTRLPVSVRDLPVIYLAIPGSHNTMTYTINRESDVGPDEPRYVRALGRYVSPVSKPVIFNWSVTQDRSVKEQLNGGIRYLDLRVATKSGDNHIYFLHGLYGSKIYQPLKEIAEWLSAHSNEIVILDFQHFYLFTEMNHRHLVETIYQTFQNKLCPVLSKFDRITLYRLNLDKHQVIVIYRNAYAQSYSHLWPSGLWRTPWPNTVRVNQLINFLDVELKSRSLEIGFVSQCLLTPDVFYVLRNLCGTLKANLVTQCQKDILSWINQKQPGQGGLNVVIADFIADNEFVFCRTVVDSNKKLLKV
ncbi:PI-PLC X domain-containing protein 2 [Xylocopa sonorina]|uniref:PI-PLC X domain-containing protein 2 n=1 Tax=Xylocopa sonorina TaxID=1818115 RepID=UPI00403ACA8E